MKVSCSSVIARYGIFDSHPATISLEKMEYPESKEPDAFASDSFVSCQLCNGNDVACLRSLGALLNSELDLLAFFQVLVPIALNG